MTKTYLTFVDVRVAVGANNKADAKTAIKGLIGEMRAALPTGCSVDDYDVEAAVDGVYAA